MRHSRCAQPTTKGDPAANLFDEVTASFEASGIVVQETKKPGIPSVILLCPELYQRPELNAALEDLLGVPEEARALDVGETAANTLNNAASAFKNPVGAVSKLGAMATSKPDPSAAKGNKAAKKAAKKGAKPAPKEAPKASDGSKRFKAKAFTGRGGKEEPPPQEILWLPFYSTTNTPAWYKRRAPKRLKEHSTFAGFEFEPWPATPSMQQVATQLVAEKLVAVRHPVVGGLELPLSWQATPNDPHRRPSMAGLPKIVDADAVADEEEAGPTHEETREAIAAKVAAWEAAQPEAAQQARDEAAEAAAAEAQAKGGSVKEQAAAAAAAAAQTAAAQGGSVKEDAAAAAEAAAAQVKVMGGSVTEQAASAAEAAAAQVRNMGGSVKQQADIAAEAAAAQVKAMGGSVREQAAATAEAAAAAASPEAVQQKWGGFSGSRLANVPVKHPPLPRGASVSDQLQARRVDLDAEAAAVAAASEVKAKGGSVKERAAAAAAAAEAVRDADAAAAGGSAAEAASEISVADALLQASPRVPTPRGLMISKHNDSQVVRL